MVMRKRKIIFTTGIRSDFYIQSPVMQAVQEHRNLECLVIITGAHLSKRFGNTVNEVEKNNYNIVAKINNLVLSDRLSSRVEGAAVQLRKIIKVFEKVKPDIVVAPFDREEAITVALAGVYMNIPVAHLGAGDKTRVNVDGIIRHSVSKLSHILFTSTRENAERIIKMGEEKWRVFNVGHAGLDRYRKTPHLTREEISSYLGLDINSKPLIVLIQHPVSNEINRSGKQISVTLSALDKLNYPTVIIYPNSDPGRNIMVSAIKEYNFKNEQIKRVKNIPELYFVNLMRYADVLVGNSSMGVLEAPMLKLPVVNVGMRQMDREHAENIIFVPHNESEIRGAVEKCLYDERFKERVNKSSNPYGKGLSGEKIANILSKIKIDDRLLNKQITY
ncbi:UDP-N,N'-diacetylbacillosamine 2-epimerase [bacterium BMS3Abin10]|nr:UDP-N,N'-diacetylbacillosamine 2-epimerase [bacterium BMS3Abin10]GBE39918.1 UDP-N,N'-diacetylbacillosamine 2-epimerase [bacterium BMS3Bbin08]